MNPIHAAAAADRQQTWTEGLRISEIAQTSSVASRPSSSVPYADILRNVSGTLQLAWKWLERKRTLQLASRRLRIAETISLGEKRSVSIVQVDGAQFLIGCSAGSVQLLAVLDKKDSVIDCSSEIERAS